GDIDTDHGPRGPPIGHRESERTGPTADIEQFARCGKLHKIEKCARQPARPPAKPTLVCGPVARMKIRQLRRHDRLVPAVTRPPRGLRIATQRVERRLTRVVQRLNTDCDVDIPMSHNRYDGSPIGGAAAAARHFLNLTGGATIARGTDPNEAMPKSLAT